MTPLQARTGAGRREEEGSGDNKFTIMFHGTIVERHGLDTALEAINRLKDKVPNIRFEVFGDGEYVPFLLKLMKKYSLEDTVRFHGTVPIEEIARSIREIDLGLIPNKKSPFTDINMPTRIFEYLCLGKPVIAPRTTGILDYFDEESLNFFEPSNFENLAQVILNVYSDSELRKRSVEKGMAVYNEHRWEKERKYLVDLVKSLLGMTDGVEDS